MGGSEFFSQSTIFEMNYQIVFQYGEHNFPQYSWFDNFSNSFNDFWAIFLSQKS